MAKVPHYKTFKEMRAITWRHSKLAEEVIPKPLEEKPKKEPKTKKEVKEDAG